MCKLWRFDARISSMAHLFDKMMSKTRSKSSFEAVSRLVAALEKLSDSSPEKLQEDIAKCLALIKVKYR